MKRRKNPSMRRVGENLWLRHGRYCARIRRGNKDIWRSLKTQDRNIATARLLALRSQIAAQTSNPSRENAPIFKDAAKVLLERARLEVRRGRTLEKLRSSLNRSIASFLGRMQMNRIGINHLREYLHQRAAERSGRTANHDLTALRKLFKLAVEKGWRWDDPTQGIKQFPHKEKTVPVPSLEEIKQVLAAMRDGRMRAEACRAADFIEFLALSGLRLAEAQALQCEDINLSQGILVVKEGKGGKSRVIDISPALREYLTRLLQPGAPSPNLVFPKSGKKPYNPKRALDSACRIAGVPRFCFHGLRHAWATELVKAGIDFGTIAKWAGHSDGGLLIAKRYGNHMRRDHMQLAAQKATFSLV